MARFCSSRLPQAWHPPQDQQQRLGSAGRWSGGSDHAARLCTRTLIILTKTTLLTRTIGLQTRVMHNKHRIVQLCIQTLCTPWSTHLISMQPWIHRTAAWHTDVHRFLLTQRSGRKIHTQWKIYRLSHVVQQSTCVEVNTLPGGSLQLVDRIGMCQLWHLGDIVDMLGRTIDQSYAAYFTGGAALRKQRCVAVFTLFWSGWIFCFQGSASGYRDQFWTEKHDNYILIRDATVWCRSV